MGICTSALVSRQFAGPSSENRDPFLSFRKNPNTVNICETYSDHFPRSALQNQNNDELS